MRLHHTLAALHNDLRSGKHTCLSVVQHYLDRIAAQAHLNAFLEVYADEALQQARELDQRIQQNGLDKAGRLAGMVIAIKDNIVYQGHASSASSRILGGFSSLFTATALQRLINEGAIIIGRCNCDEFAMGSSNENSAFGPVRNPIDPDRVPGGSSGGSAAAVAAGMCHASLGSDTGGSIRQPAAFCGLVGMKPTYGRISRYGLIAYASSFDQIGPFANSVEDAALLCEIMAGADENDNTSSTQPVAPMVPAAGSSAKYRIAVLGDALNSPGLSPDVRQAAQTLVDRLKAEGHTVDVVEFPILEYLVPTYYILTTAEASSNLARFDGIRYGYRAEGVMPLEQLYRRSRTEGFGSEVKRRIMLGTFVLSSGYYDAYYTKAQKVRRIIRDQTRELLGRYDFLLSPSTPTPPFRIGEKSDDPIAMYLSDIFTVHANLAGMPALSLPVGNNPEGLPLGMHLLAGEFQEPKLFAFAQQIAQAVVSS